jgi:preprotein translocase subunit SecG
MLILKIAAGTLAFIFIIFIIAFFICAFILSGECSREEEKQQFEQEHRGD